MVKISVWKDETMGRDNAAWIVSADDGDNTSTIAVYDTKADAISRAEREVAERKDVSLVIAP